MELLLVYHDSNISLSIVKRKLKAMRSKGLKGLLRFKWKQQYKRNSYVLMLGIAVYLMLGIVVYGHYYEEMGWLHAEKMLDNVC